MVPTIHKISDVFKVENGGHLALLLLSFMCCSETLYISAFGGKLINKEIISGMCSYMKLSEIKVGLDL